MPNFRDTRLYRSALVEPAGQTDGGSVQRLQVALDSFRRHAARLASTVASDLPGFTGHDVEHLDALWATADVIVGEEWTLNPAEGFVFGGAVLLHDLALSTAAYLDGPASVEEAEDFADALRLALRAGLGRDPGDEELADPEPELRNAAREAVLRRRHARRASELATTPLTGPEVDFAGGQYLRVPLGESKDQPSGLMTLWLVLIALSSLARYEPAGWTKALAPRSPLAVPIEQGLRHATLRIPVLVRDALG
jgi:hypothetical protein